MSGEGDGRDVKYGFCATAADRAACDVCGVMRVISRMLVSSNHQSKPYRNSERKIERCSVYKLTQVHVLGRPIPRQDFREEDS